MKRYELQTDKGHKMTWAPSRKAAIAKITAHGLKVISAKLMSDAAFERYVIRVCG